MKKRVPSSLIVFLILGLVFFGTCALMVWFRFSNKEFTKIESSNNQTQTSSPKTNEDEKRKSNLKGPSWDYHNPKIGNLIVELRSRIREQDERKEKLEEKYVRPGLRARTAFPFDNWSQAHPYPSWRPNH